MWYDGGRVRLTTQRAIYATPVPAVYRTSVGAAASPTPRSASTGASIALPAAVGILGGLGIIGRHLWMKRTPGQTRQTARLARELTSSAGGVAESVLATTTEYWEWLHHKVERMPVPALAVPAEQTVTVRAIQADIQASTTRRSGRSIYHVDSVEPASASAPGLVTAAPGGPQENVVAAQVKMKMSKRLVEAERESAELQMKVRKSLNGWQKGDTPLGVQD